jgi:hypothetical protein
MPAPIVLFTYRRPVHIRRTVEALLANPHARDSQLHVYSDAGTTPSAQADVDAVRAYLATITGFRSVTIRPRAVNFGLARSIVEGVTEVLAEHESAIVLEDDMVTSPHFLTYMNDALRQYATDERVASIHAYVYQVRATLPETYFLRGADCWGWATWRRAWRFEADGAALLAELRARNLTHAFDFDGTYPYTQMLEDQVLGKNDSWAVRWRASAFLQNKLTLYPGRSLVHNIGNDDSGTHSETSDVLDVSLSTTPVRVGDAPVEHSEVAYRAYAEFFRTMPNRPWWRRGLGVARRLLRS